MAKIKYSQVEQKIQEVLQKLQQKQLAEGKTITSSRAQEFYGITNESRPVQEDVIEALIEEEAASEKEQQSEPDSSEAPLLLEAGSPSLGENEELFSSQTTPTQETLLPAKKRRFSPSKRPLFSFDFSQTSETTAEKTPPLYLLRQHILWMKLHHIANRFELLQTSIKEISAWKQKSRLSDDDVIRIKELLKKAQEFKAFWLKKQGMTSSETIIDQQKKKHKNKRFNVREKWLPI